MLKCLLRRNQSARSFRTCRETPGFHGLDWRVCSKFGAGVVDAEMLVPLQPVRQVVPHLERHPFNPRGDNPWL